MISDDFCLNNTFEEKVFRIMTNIESSKATGVDRLSVRFFKNDANILAKPIYTLCNHSLSEGVLRNACKVAKLKPIFKKRKKTDPSNYKPISLPPSISKIIERVIHDQTNVFLLDEDILYNYQSGSRDNHSKILCLSFLTAKVLKGFDDGLLIGIILIDLQNALDTINHGVLLEILKATRFSESTIKWFKLGSLLFLIYVNHMPQAVGNINSSFICIPFMYPIPT